MSVISTNPITNLTFAVISGQGLITVALTSPASPVPQVGQRVKITGSTSIAPIFRTWQANHSYSGPPNQTFLRDGSFNTWMALNGGTSGTSTPLAASGPGTQVLDNIGTGFSTPPITWLQVVENISWDFDGFFHVAAVTDSQHFNVVAASQFQYFNPTLSATGTGGTAVILTSNDKIAEIHNVAPYAANSTAGLQYSTTVAYQQGIFIVQLQDNSNILTTLFNNQNNTLQLSNPQLSKQYVRLMDTQSALGTQFNGVYAISAVLSPSSFAVKPAFTQTLPNDNGGGGVCYFLNSLSMQVPPGILDNKEAVFAVGQPVSDDALLALSSSAKFACIRTEFVDLGYYINGNTVIIPRSPVDDYPYDPTECGFDMEFATSNQVQGNNPDAGSGPFTPGTPVFPDLNPAAFHSGASTLLVVPYELFVDEAGNVTCTTYDFQGLESNGALRIIAIATRGSTPTLLPVNELALPTGLL